MTVVVHRKRHPDGWRRWFSYRGRDFGVMHEGEGWGYRIIENETNEDVADALMTLDDLRRQAASACDDWYETHERSDACKRRVCLSCGTATDGRYYLCQSCDDAEAAESRTPRISERATVDDSRSTEPRSTRT